MVVINEGLQTTVSMLPYEPSSIDEKRYIRSSRDPVTVESVRDYETNLVAIKVGEQKVVVNGSQFITAIQKCLL